MKRNILVAVLILLVLSLFILMFGCGKSPTAAVEQHKDLQFSNISSFVKPTLYSNDIYLRGESAFPDTTTVVGIVYTGDTTRVLNSYRFYPDRFVVKWVLKPWNLTKCPIDSIVFVFNTTYREVCRHVEVVPD